MKLLNTFKIAAAVVGAIGLISSAQAGTFTISTDLTTINAPTPFFQGSISANNGTVFTINGLVSSINVNPGQTTLDLLGAISANGAGSITLCLSEDGFTPIQPIGFNVVANGGLFTNPVTVSDVLMINGIVAGTTDVITLNPPGGGASSGTFFVTPTTDPFSLENCVTITFGAGGGFISFDKTTFPGVPDSGMTLSLLGIGLLALAGMAKMRVGARA